MKAGDAVLIAPDVLHSHQQLASTECWSVHLRACDVDIFLPIVDAHRGHFSTMEQEAIGAILSSVRSGRLAPSPVLRLQLGAIVAALLGEPDTLSRACVSSPTVKAALDVISGAYATLERPSDVARLLGKSPGYVTDLVRAETGRPIAAWLRERRLFAASLLLATHTSRVLDVALAVGFSDPGHFARQFSRRFAVVPSAWREYISSGSFASRGSTDDR